MLLIKQHHVFTQVLKDCCSLHFHARPVDPTQCRLGDEGMEEWIKHTCLFWHAPEQTAVHQPNPNTHLHSPEGFASHGLELNQSGPFVECHLLLCAVMGNPAFSTYVLQRENLHGDGQLACYVTGRTPRLSAAVRQRLTSSHPERPTHARLTPPSPTIPFQVDVGAALMALVGTRRSAHAPSQSNLRHTAHQQTKNSALQCDAELGVKAETILGVEEEEQLLRSTLAAIAGGGAGLAGEVFMCRLLLHEAVCSKRAFFGRSISITQRSPAATLPASPVRHQCQWYMNVVLFAVFNITGAMPDWRRCCASETGHVRVTVYGVRAL